MEACIFVQRKLSNMHNTEKMYELYQTGKTLREVGAEFGLSAQYVKVLFAKSGLATRNKPRTRNKPSKVGAIAFDWADERKAWGALDTKIKGEVAENYVKNRLLELGFEVWVSITPNSKSDMAVVCPSSGRLIRIQVKCATYVETDKRYRAIITTKDKRGEKVKYRSDDIDFFIVFCPFVKQFYVLPISVVGHASNLNLLPHRERFKTTANIYETYLDAFGLLCK